MVVKLALKRKNENIQIWSRYSLFKNTGCSLPASSSAALNYIFLMGSKLWWIYSILFMTYGMGGKQQTVQWSKNAVNFLKNVNKGHPIARPLGPGVGCLLWIQHLIDILPQFLQSLMQYLTIFMVHTEIFEWNLMTFPWPFKDLFKQ